MLDKNKYTNEIHQRTVTETNDFYIVIALIEIREAVDRYIEQRIKSDKVIEGILKDIYSAVQESGSQN